MQTFTFRAMGSQILIAIDQDAEKNTEIGSMAAAWFEEWEQIFSRFRITSELSKVNNTRTHAFVSVSETFWQVLLLAIEIEKKTNGLVTPKILNALENSGYDRTFEDLGTEIDLDLHRSFISPEGSSELELDLNHHQLRVPNGTRLDFGGFVKGWAAQQVMNRLKTIAPVLVDAGGDIAVSGPMRDGQSWPIGLSDPLHEGQSLAVLMTQSGGIATSGKDYRRWLKGNLWQHHIIDPRTDSPAETDILTATVLSKDLVDAEAWAKSALILGSELGKQQLDSVKGIEYFFVLDNGNSIESSGFSKYRWSEKWQTQQAKVIV